MPDHTDDDQKAEQIWLAAEFAAMRANIETLPDAKRYPRPVHRAMSRSLRIRSVTVTEEHAEYVQHGLDAAADFAKAYANHPANRARRARRWDK